jgi:hypothetical protein
VPEEKYNVDNQPGSNDSDVLNASRQATSRAVSNEEALNVKSVKVNAELVLPKSCQDDKSKTAMLAVEACKGEAMETSSVAIESKHHSLDNSLDNANCASRGTKDDDTKTLSSGNELLSEQNNTKKSLGVVSEVSPDVDIVVNNNRQKTMDSLNIRGKADEFPTQNENEYSRTAAAIPSRDEFVGPVPGKTDKATKTVLKNQTVEVMEQL